MAVPVLLVTGALGAGKTTLIGRLLSEPAGRRLAAIVNDFGAIDIDAALLGSVSDGVVSLKNGCICCSLQMDLLATLSKLLRRDPMPDGIVIETSGVSNPAEIVRALLDPVIWKAAALDAVVTGVDGRMLADRPETAEEVLWLAQLQAADYVALSKTDLLDPAEREQVAALLRRRKPDRLVHEMVAGRFPRELLFSVALQEPAEIASLRAMVALPEFWTVSWTSTQPLLVERFQAVIGRFATDLLRAKGILSFAGKSGAPALFQLVGSRATFGPAPAEIPAAPAARLVFIARAGAFDEAELRRCLDDCRSPNLGNLALPPSHPVPTETAQ